MKTLLLIVSLFLCGCIQAQNNKESKNAPPADKTSSYCMMKQGDALVLMKDGKQVYTDIKLDDGTRITTNGRILKTDGSEQLLKENECANLDGEILKPAKEKK